MITAEYLAELALSWSLGERHRVRRILEAQGKQIEEDDGAWIVRSDGFTCGLLLDCSPVDALPQLLFALIGPMWPLAVGKAFDKAQKIISKQWKELKRKETPIRAKTSNRGGQRGKKMDRDWLRDWDIATNTPAVGWTQAEFRLALTYWLQQARELEEKLERLLEAVERLFRRDFDSVSVYELKKILNEEFGREVD